MRIHPRKKLDIGPLDIASGLLGCATTFDRAKATRALEAQWSPEGRGFACLSIRTGFDLLLQTLNLPRGSEVLVSAITIPHMIELIEHHGLVPVPVDLDMARVQVRADLLRSAITERTRAILVAHIFGCRMDLDPVVQIARSHDLLLIEDCAQAYDGRDGYRGHPGADVSMFSFGTIKTATALGGALFTVNRPGLVDGMRQIMATYPVQPRAAYAKRLLQIAVYGAACSSSLTYGMTVRAIEATGRDYDAFIMAVSRGFSGPDFFTRIRHQPCAPLLALMKRRITADTSRQLARRAQAGRAVLSALPADVTVVGGAHPDPTFWLFPVVATLPATMTRDLRAAGFDATGYSSSLTWVKPPEQGPGDQPLAARRAMERLVYVPLDGDMPAPVLASLAQVLAESATRRSLAHEAHATQPYAAA